MNREHYDQVRQALGSAQLCVVSKKRSEEEILSYYEAGERIFGENHANELVSKASALPEDIEWQFIGHLQRNKVRSILPYVKRIQSLDNLPLAKVIEKEAAKLNRTVSVFVEFHLAEEDTNKTGLAKDDAVSFITEVAETCPHIKIEGIMAMGPHTEDEERVRAVFTEAHDLYLDLQNRFGKEMIRHLSMGMSQDYRIALKCGSTMVRIGTYLFEKEEEEV